jgi:GntR family transcriptional regulator/MocR family aminotransferase
MRRSYAGKREILVRTLAERAPGVGLTGLAAGFHAVAALPAGVTEAAAVERAGARGVGLYGMSPHRSSGAADPAQLVLGFGNLTGTAIRDGLVRVADLLGGPAAPPPDVPGSGR